MMRTVAAIWEVRCGDFRRLQSRRNSGGLGRRTDGMGWAMEVLARLEAIEEIRALKARYFRLIDTKQWHLEKWYGKAGNTT